MRALVDMESSGLVAMLEGDKYDDLGRMYALLKRVDGGMGLMRQVGGARVHACVRACVGIACVGVCAFCMRALLKRVDGGTGLMRQVGGGPASWGLARLAMAAWPASFQRGGLARQVPAERRIAAQAVRPSVSAECQHAHASAAPPPPALQVMGDHVKESGRQLVMDQERQKDPIRWGAGMVCFVCVCMCMCLYVCVSVCVCVYARVHAEGPHQVGGSVLGVLCVCV